MARRVVFFGTPTFAVPSLSALLDSPDRVVGVVTQPDRPRGRGQQVRPEAVKILAETRGLPVLQPERLKEDAFLSAFRALEPDIAIVAAYGRILPASLLEMPSSGLPQRPRVAAAAVARRRARASRDPGGRSSVGRDHHARRSGARCRSDAGVRGRWTSDPMRPARSSRRGWRRWVRALLVRTLAQLGEGPLVEDAAGRARW